LGFDALDTKQFADSDEPLTPIQGNPPSLIDLPEGCAFSPRCPYAQARCGAEDPVLVEIEDTHASACFFSADPDFLMNSPLHDNDDEEAVLGVSPDTDSDADPGAHGGGQDG